MSFCGDCGSPVNGARFCTNCGAATGASAPPVVATRAVPAPARAAAFSPAAAPVGWSVHQGPTGMPSPSAGPTGSGTKRRVGWWIAGFVAAVGVGVGVAYYLLRTITVVSGADTPEAAVIDLVQAINDKDLVRAVTLLPPDELGQISDALASAETGLTRVGLVDGPVENGDDGALAALLSGVNLHARGIQLRSELIDPDLARVTVTGGLLEASVDPAHTTGLLRTALDSSFVAATGVAARVDVQDIDVPIVVAAVRRDDRWFVSPIYTAGEYLLSGTDSVRAPATARAGGGPIYATPEAAARGLLDQVGATVNNRDSSLLADGLTSGESQAVLVYRRGIDALLADLDVEVSHWDASFEVVQNTGDVAVVRPTLISFVGDDGSHQGSIEIQDGCVLLDGQRRGCVTDLAGSTDLNVRLAGTEASVVDLDLVVRREGDGWRVSLGATATHLLTTAVETISPSQARMLTGSLLTDDAAAKRLMLGLPSDTQVGLDQVTTLDFAPTEAYKVVDVVVRPGQSIDYQAFPALPGACILRGIFSADGEELTRIEDPGTYRLIVVGVVQNDDGYYRYVHAPSCAVRVESR